MLKRASMCIPLLSTHCSCYYLRQPFQCALAARPSSEAASYPTLLEDAGLLPPQEGPVHSGAHVLSRSLGEIRRSAEVKPPPAPVRTKPQLQEVQLRAARERKLRELAEADPRNET